MHGRLNIGDQLGEYRVTHFLGSGGMGDVYRGEHAKLGRQAAIKVLSSTVNNESFKARFSNEAKLQARLHHPHVAALYDFQEIGGRLCIFMEFVDGESLDALIERRAFSIEDALKAFRSMVEAIGYIHANNIVHRDLKSQNIKVNSNGKVKLLDFGIAKGADSHNLTQIGGVIGTPHYFAPEQLDGAEASPQSDLWALGVILYEMLTGRLPFEADSFASLCYLILMNDFTPAESLNPKIPKEVVHIINKILKKNPAERYQTAEEVLLDVRRAISSKDVPIPAPKISAERKSGFVSNPNPQVWQTSGPVQPNPTNSANSVNTPYSAPASSTVYPTPNVQALEAPKKKLPIGLIVGATVGAVIILFIILGLAIWAMSGSKPQGNVVINNRNVKANQVVVVPSGSTQRIKIDIDEGKAEVWQNGSSIGMTPLDLDKKTGEKFELTLKRPGYEDKTVQIEVAVSKSVYTFSLKPVKP